MAGNSGYHRHRGAVWTSYRLIQRRETSSHKQRTRTIDLTISARLETRLTVAAARYAELAERFEGQSQFLRLVTDSQPNAIFIADADGKYHFANREAARPTGIRADDMLGKTLASVIGPDAAKYHLDLNREALETGNTVS